MKIKNLLLLFFFNTSFIFAQVGINTNTPQETLDINGTIRIQDGTQGLNKVLTSDANGSASWNFSTIQNVFGTIGTGVDIPSTTTTFLQTGSSITLPPGSYVINVTMLIYGGSRAPSDSNKWIRTTFSDNSTGDVISTDIIGSNLISGNQIPSSIFSILAGTIVIENSTALDKTYYYIAGDLENFNNNLTLIGFGGSAWSENNIVAFKIE